jgi:FecR protein
MKNYLGSIGTVLVTGTLILGMGAAAGAQQAPPASQQPMEIPAQYPPQPQGVQQTQGQPQQAPQNDPGAARISFIHGDVSTQHDGSNDWAAATLNTPVVNGDHISTGQNARAEIQLDHANVLRLSDQTTANVLSLSRTQMQLQIGQGLANYEVFKNNEANIEIQTPNVAIHPQMGEGSYRVLVNSDGETIVDVRKGSAEISTPQGSTRVERDQRITIQGNVDNAQYQVSGAPGRDDWDRWNGDRDRAIEGAQSWQHTNPYYTGTQDLDANGQWTNVPDYGSVWFPAEAPGWAPYRDGRWVYEPYYGWTWVSYEPWGWAPYHYGRWFVYGGNWGWWPGPVYAGYYPVWAPAYVSFFGFGGGGWGVNFGFGFGGYGNVGWLPCGPGDRFFPWYGRGINRVNVVNINNIHNNFGGMNPLRQGPHAFSNVDRAVSDARVRNGISSMQSNEFGHGRVSMQQSRIDPATFRKASLMTGANPVSPSRESFQSTNRQANPSSIPNRSSSNQHFFSSTSRQSSPIQTGRGASNFNRGGNPAGNLSRGPVNEQGQRGFTPPASQHGQSIQSSRPGWRTFTPPSGQPQSNGSRAFAGQGGAQPRSNYSQPSQSPRGYQGNTRGGVSNYGSNRPTLSMQQPVVTPRGGGSYSGRPTMPSAPSGGGGGGYHGGPSGGGSYSGRPMPSAPSGGGYRGAPSGGGSRGGNNGRGSHGGSSSGGHSSSGHNSH